MTALNRRELLLNGLVATVGSAGLLLFNACGGGRGPGGEGLSPGSNSGPCPLNPEQEEGPFYVDEGLLRSDVTDGQTGIPLLLSLKVVKAVECIPVANAAVEIWAANSLGKYSDKLQEGTVGQKYLRGVQLTDALGQVKFKSIYPGWYGGRTCHVHLKVRTGGAISGTSYSTAGSVKAFGGQMFFPPAVNEILRSKYTADTNTFVNNEGDMVYNNQGGERALLALDGSFEDGYAGALTVHVNA